MFSSWYTVFKQYKEAQWQGGQVVGWLARLAMRRFRVQVQLWPLAGFLLGRLEFKSSATLVNSQLVASCQLGVNPVTLYLNYLFLNI